MTLSHHALAESYEDALRTKDKAGLICALPSNSSEPMHEKASAQRITSTPSLALFETKKSSVNKPISD